MQKSDFSQAPNQQKPRAPSKFIAASAIAFLAFFIFPFFAHAEPLRAIFSDWTPVVIEFALLFLVLFLMSLCIISEPPRDRARDDLSFPP